MFVFSSRSHSTRHHTPAGISLAVLVCECGLSFCYLGTIFFAYERDILLCRVCGRPQASRTVRIGKPRRPDTSKSTESSTVYCYTNIHTYMLNIYIITCQTNASGNTVGDHEQNVRVARVTRDTTPPGSTFKVRFGVSTTK